MQMTIGMKSNMFCSKMHRKKSKNYKNRDKGISAYGGVCSLNKIKISMAKL